MNTPGLSGSPALAQADLFHGQAEFFLLEDLLQLPDVALLVFGHPLQHHSQGHLISDDLDSIEVGGQGLTLQRQVLLEHLREVGRLSERGGLRRGHPGLRIPRIPATQSMGRLPLNPREACHPVHVKPATWTTGSLPPNPGEACHRRSAATLGGTLLV